MSHDRHEIQPDRRRSVPTPNAGPLTTEGVAGRPSSRHVTVWMDHRRARIFHVERDRGDQVRVIATPHAIQDAHATADGPRFFAEVVDALPGAEEVLLLGPSAAKAELVRFAQDREEGVTPRIVGVETVDNATDGQVVAYARRYFGAPPVARKRSA
jgi:hypothetical protein